MASSRLPEMIALTVFFLLSWLEIASHPLLIGERILCSVGDRIVEHKAMGRLPAP